MSFKTGLVKMAIKLTPNFIVVWVANIILKGIADLEEFFFDLDVRSAYFRLTLNGESEPIEVSLDGFAVISEGDSHYFIIEQAHANRPWLNNLFSRVVGKPWNIPAIPHCQAEIELLCELFNAEKA